MWARGTTRLRLGGKFQARAQGQADGKARTKAQAADAMTVPALPSCTGKVPTSGTGDALSVSWSWSCPPRHPRRVQSGVGDGIIATAHRRDGLPAGYAAGVVTRRRVGVPGPGTSTCTITEWS